MWQLLRRYETLSYSSIDGSSSAPRRRFPVEGSSQNMKLEMRTTLAQCWKRLETPYREWKRNSGRLNELAYNVKPPSQTSRRKYTILSARTSSGSHKVKRKRLSKSIASKNTHEENSSIHER